jgi:hypothetical protein
MATIIKYAVAFVLLLIPLRIFYVHSDVSRPFYGCSDGTCGWLVAFFVLLIIEIALLINLILKASDRWLG